MCMSARMFLYFLGCLVWLSVRLCFEHVYFFNIPYVYTCVPAFAFVCLCLSFGAIQRGQCCVPVLLDNLTTPLSMHFPVTQTDTNKQRYTHRHTQRQTHRGFC